MGRRHCRDTQGLRPGASRDRRLVDQLHPDTPGYPAAAVQQMSGDLADNIAGERFFVRLLPALTLPMAIVVGALDRSMPVDTLQALSAAHPNMAFRSVPDAGHALAWENPAVFNPLLRDFISRATDRAASGTTGR
jgi:pimeloyl-ACP methyl ester carboxylesterase